MKVTIVPAQITTIEDRIAGNLGLSQLLLLAAPVFGGSALYVVLPPTMHSATYKLVVVTVLAFLCAISAIRIKGKILLFWLLTIVRYNLRPRYYLFNKNDLAAREQYETDPAPQTDTEQDTKPAKRTQLPLLSTSEAARVLAVIENPAAHLSFDVNHKGGLNVRITEVKQQG